MKLKSLTPTEAKVILYQGTEAPFSGEYEQFDQEGIYSCKRCGAYLYRSDTKFDARCGWPSFDQEILGAVTSIPDPDGQRTEIVCARCQAHLGHVFTGEHFTNANTRHCVNSVSLQFIPQDQAKTTAFAYFGGGCFWCTEAVFKLVQGVNQVSPGYAGGAGEPTYESVSTGNTGHAEIVKIEFNPTIISYEGLLTVFFSTHDPTTPNQQENDIGTQYRSLILYNDALQKELAYNFVDKLTKQQIFDQPIVTQIVALQHFYPAETYHHNYYANHQQQPYCQVVINPKLNKLKKTLKSYLIQT